MSKLENTLALHIRALKLPEPVREHMFHPSRKWRFDFAWPELKLAAEVEGGTESHGQKRRINGKTITIKSRHLTPSGFREDCNKYNQAALLGWRVLRFSGAMITKGEAIQTIRDILGG